MTRRKIIDIVLSIVSAIFLWAYVVNVINPPTTTLVRNVPVQLQNQEVLASSKLALLGSTNYTVDVTLAGKRSDLSDVSAAQLVATADLFGLSAGQNYLTVNVTCPGNLTVEEIKSNRIQVLIEDLVTVNKPVDLIIGEVDDGYELTMDSTGSTHIAVSGAKSLVNKVMSIRAELDPDELMLDETTTLILDAMPLDKDGNIVEGVKLANSYVEVKGTVYATKTVALSINLDGEPAYGAEVDYTGLPTKILIKGSQDALNSVRSINTKVIDIANMTAEKTVKLVPVLPDGIMLSDKASSLKVSIKLIDHGKIDYTVPVEDIEITGCPENFEAKLAASDAGSVINIHVEGTINAIMAAQQEYFVPYVDLSSMEEEGTFGFELINSYDGNDYTVSYETDIINVELVSLLQEDPEDIKDGADPASNESVGP